MLENRDRVVVREPRIGHAMKLILFCSILICGGGVLLKNHIQGQAGGWSGVQTYFRRRTSGR